MVDLDKIEISDVVYYLRQYDKKTLAVDNAILRRAHNVQAIIKEAEEAMRDFEEVLNRYIDNRIEHVLERKEKNRE